MNPIELQNAFEIEMNRRDSSMTISSDKAFYFINEAADEFVKERVSGNNFQREALEQTQKRIDDLRTLIVSTVIVPTVNSEGYDKPNSYSAELPANYFTCLEEEVDITANGTTKRQGVKEVTSDTYRTNLDDVYSEHNLQYGSAKPLRLFENDKVLLITDGNYTVNNYYLRYLKLPNEVDLNAYMADNQTGLLDLPEHTHIEVIKIAVRMAIENAVDVRYQSYINEVNNVE